MTMKNNLMSEDVAVVATIDPDVTAAGAVTSDWVDMGLYDQVLAIAMAGTLGTSATFDAKLQQATDSSGTGAKDIAGKAITQLTEAGADSDKQALINCRAEELDLAGGFTHVALVITVAVATSDAGGLILGGGSRYLPADNDLASVDEIVN
jgi:hypothetical protein